MPVSIHDTHARTVFRSEPSVRAKRVVALARVLQNLLAPLIEYARLVWLARRLAERSYGGP